MSGTRGRRFDEPKLNIKKVIALIVAILIIVMIFVSIKNLLTRDKKAPDVSVQKTYFSVIDNNKWGVINNSGEYVINPEYDEMVVIPNKNKDVFICFDNVDYENEAYNTIVYNEKNEKILSDYSKVEAIENYDNSGNWYETDLLKYENNGKYGLINLEGKKILEEEFDKIYPIPEIQKSIIVEKDGKQGLVNSSSNKLIINPEYEKIEALTKEYTDGYIVTNSEGKSGLIDINGKMILECNYDKIQNVAGNNSYVVEKENKNIVINDKGEDVFEIGNKEVLAINTNGIVYKENDKVGLINTSGENLINNEYDYLKYIYEDLYIASKDGKYGIINSNNEIKIDFNYKNIIYIDGANIVELDKEENTSDLLGQDLEVKLSDVIVSEVNIEKGYLRVRKDSDYKYYNFKFEEKTNIEVLPTNTLFLVKEDGKYGYINSKGEKIVDCIYDDAKEQNEFGYCVVKKDGLWGTLKSDGTVDLEPSVNLDDSLYIEFISKWHLDNILNIYTK